MGGRQSFVWEKLAMIYIGEPGSVLYGKAAVICMVLCRAVKMAMVDPHTGKIMKAETVLVDGVECLPKFDPTKLSYETKEEHPLYRTTANTIGAKKPCVYDVPTNYL